MVALGDQHHNWWSLPPLGIARPQLLAVTAIMRVTGTRRGFYSLNVTLHSLLPYSSLAVLLAYFVLTLSLLL